MSPFYFLSLFLCSNFVWSQNLITAQQNPLTSLQDTVIKPIKINIVVENLIVDRMKTSQLNLENNNALRNQSKAFNLITREIQKANNILDRGIDYKGFRKEINLLFKWKDFAVEGKTKNKNQAIRDLTTTSILLNELAK